MAGSSALGLTGVGHGLKCWCLAYSAGINVNLSTGVWEIYTKPFNGLTCYKQTMVIDASEKKGTKDYLDSLVHEAIHASRKDFTEAEVIRLAKDITTVLWSLGIRRRGRAAGGR
jgi:hypothetical protein